MEENEVVEQEVETDLDFDAFDDGWGELNEVEEEQEDHDDETPEPEETDPVDESENAEDEPETDEYDEDGEATEEPREEPREGNQLFEINYLGNKEQLTLEQMTELAQKGRDYDHVRQERDDLKAGTGKHEAFLKKLAEKSGVSVDEQIDLTEAMWLMDEEAEKGNKLTEAEALLRVQRNRNGKQDEGSADKGDSEKPVISPMIQKFTEVYPKVRAEDIPKEVWDEATRIGDLLGAYQAWRISELEKASESRKRTDLNDKNEKRSTGPRKSAGANRQRDPFDEGWDS